MSKRIAIIAGSGFEALLQNAGRQLAVATPWGERNNHVLMDNGDEQLVYLARHGLDHGELPHRINYRANIAALLQQGVEQVVSLNVVGGIDPTLSVGQWVIPDQIIDYTWGREHTFFDAPDALATLEFNLLHRHVDFSEPFCPRLRAALREALEQEGLRAEADGVYGAAQGPRLETAAEIRRMAQDGCTIVGMTGMPEAGLAREAGIDYAMLSLVVNPAAGVAGGTVPGLDAIPRLVAEAAPVALRLARVALMRA